MTQAANPWRGEAMLELDGQAHVLRPSFAALVAAEEELGPLFTLVERAAAGNLRLAELAALYWHCLANRAGLERAAFAEALVGSGLAHATQPLRGLLAQVLQGRAEAA
ncbi:MAG: hypothetical protein RL671_328 [Pseudomonadota bacterium]|jgi:hypothetical protein